MTLISLFKLVFSSFKKRKSRILLTIIGVSVAIAAVLFLVSLGYGLQKLFLEKIATQESLLTLDISPVEEGGIVINDDVLNRISAISNVEEISPQASFTSQFALGKLVSQSNLNIITPSFFALSGFRVLNGKVFDNSIHQVLVINPAMAHLFNLSPAEIVNQKVKITILTSNLERENQLYSLEDEFEIIGVVEDGLDEPQAYLRKSDIDFPITAYQMAKVKVRDSHSLNLVRNQLIRMGFSVSSVSDVVEQANKVFRLVTIVLSIFGIVAVVVAAIGLLNTMTISLLERTSQIGIMRAVGASPNDIKKLFLAESSIIGFLGGVGGIILGIIISQVFNWFLNLLARTLGGEPVNIFCYPSWFIFFIIFFSTIIGIIGGFFPARRAAGLNPLKALRYK